MSLEKAVRLKYRFPSNKGLLTVEQLWDLPLQSKTGFDLDSVAKEISASLKAESEDSFVTPRNSERKTQLEEGLAIVVHIIAVKQAENAANLQRAEKARLKAQLTEVLHVRTQAELLTKTPAEIQAMIDALNTDASAD